MWYNRCCFVLLLMVVNGSGTRMSTPLKKLTTSQDLNQSPNGGPYFGSPQMQSEEKKATKISTKGPSCPKSGGGKQTVKKRKRILGGLPYDPKHRDAKEPDWEHWTASLMILIKPLGNGNWDVNQCGGALITKKHVLTAAHCLTDLETPDILDPTHVFIFFDVENAKIHKGLMLRAEKFFYVNMHVDDGKVQYYPNTRTVKDDIAVIELEREIEDKDCLHPIKITNKPLERPFRPVGAHDRYWMAGWGLYTFAPARSSENLRYINRQPSIPCTEDQAIDLDKNICFKRTNEYSTCFGDSGSPGVIKLTDEWYLQGIHKGNQKAAGYRTGYCNETRSIGVDINVFKYKVQIGQWIKPYVLEI